MYNVPAREEPACATSRLGRKHRARAAKSALLGTTSRLGRDRPEQRPGLGETQDPPSRLPGQTPGHLSAREGNSLPSQDVAPNWAGFASQTRKFLPSRNVAPNKTAFASQICELLPRRDIAQLCFSKAELLSEKSPTSTIKPSMPLPNPDGRHACPQPHTKQRYRTSLRERKVIKTLTVEAPKGPEIVTRARMICRSITALPADCLEREVPTLLHAIPTAKRTSGSGTRR